jgi:hypothetical protein
MDENGNYPGERPKILGPQPSVQHVQKQLEKIGNRRSSGCERIKQRKLEILEKVGSHRANLDRILSRQDVVPKLALATSVAVCLFGIFQLVRGGFDLARWVSGWREPQIDEVSAIEAQLTGTSVEQEEPDESGGNEARTTPRRLHARHWNIWEHT